MKGLYFINTDIAHPRAHTTQILNTVAALRRYLPLALIAPRYRNKPREDVTFLSSLGFKKPRAAAFIFFNIPASIYLIYCALTRRPDFIYIRSSLFLPLVVTAYLLRIPVYYETHRTPQSKSEGWRDEIIARLADGLLLVSSYVERAYARYKKPTIAVHDAVDLTYFAPQDKAEARRALGISQDARLCLYTGTISRLKGLHTLFEAAKQLPDTIFLLAGILGPEFKDTAFPENVRWVGLKRQEELPPFLAAADALLLPHPENEYSQSPMKLFEYMAAARPIVATRLPSVCEVLNEANAVLVAHDDAEALAEGIRAVFAHPEVSAARAAQASLDVQEYTWEKRGARIAAFIRETLPEHERLRRLLLLARCLARALLHGRARKGGIQLHKVLVVLTGKLGDVVCTTPVLRALRAHLPDAHIIAAGTLPLVCNLLADSGLADEYLDLRAPDIESKIRALAPEAALVTGPSFTATAHAYLAGVPLVIVPEILDGYSPANTKPYRLLRGLLATYPYRMREYAPRERLRSLEALGIVTNDTTKRLAFSPEAKGRVDQFLAEHGIDRRHDFIVGISPTAGHKIKEWPAERFAAVANHLIEKHGARIIITDERKDAEPVLAMKKRLRHEAVDASGAFDLPAFKALIAACKLFVSVDTGPIYIAEAFDVPTVDITGPIDEREQPPRGSRHRNVVPLTRDKPELFVLNARSYDREEAVRQLMSISIEQVTSAIDDLVLQIQTP